MSSQQRLFTCQCTLRVATLPKPSFRNKQCDLLLFLDVGVPASTIQRKAKVFAVASKTTRDGWQVELGKLCFPDLGSDKMGNHQTETDAEHLSISAEMEDWVALFADQDNNAGSLDGVRCSGQLGASLPSLTELMSNEDTEPCVPSSSNCSTNSSFHFDIAVSKFIDPSSLIPDADGLLTSLSSSFCVPSPTRSASSDRTPSARASSDSTLTEPSSEEDLLKEDEFDAMAFWDQGLDTIVCRSEGEMKQKIDDISQVYENDVICVSTNDGEMVCESEKVGDKKRKLERRSENLNSEDTTSRKRKSEWEDIEEEDRKPEDDEKRQVRLLRNRESAQLSRQRKKMYVDELEERLRTMNSTIAELNNTINLISAENVSLRNQLSVLYQSPAPATGVKPANFLMGMPAPPMYPYPGTWCGRVMMPGSSAPPMPIPRLKTQKSPSARNGRKVMEAAPHKGTCQNKRKSKKLASVAAFGILLIMVLILPINQGLVSFPRARLNNITRQKTGGRVLMSLDEAGPSWNSSSTRQHGWSMLRALQPLQPVKEKFLTHSRGTMPYLLKEPTDNMMKYSKDTNHFEKSNVHRQNTIPRQSKISVEAAAITNSSFLPDALANSTERMAASLIVPRNDKLVKIDGNLIIQAVMAGDKAARESRKHQPLREAGKLNQKLEKNIPAILQTLLKASGSETSDGMPDVRKSMAILHSLINEGGSKSDKNGPERPIKLAMGKQKALPPMSGSALPRADKANPVHQWTLDDYAGSLLTTGVCKEIFQFEIPESPESNPNASSRMTESYTSASHVSNQFRGKGRRPNARRIPLMPVRKDRVSGLKRRKNNETQTAGPSLGQQEAPKRSSMVVSILAGQTGMDEENPSGGKGLSQIFVVVLVDSVKYITYSCTLPLGPPLKLVAV